MNFSNKSEAKKRIFSINVEIKHSELKNPIKLNIVATSKVSSVTSDGE